MEKGSDVIIFCSASVPGTQDSDPSLFKWFRWNGKADVDISKEIGDSKSKRSTMIYNQEVMSKHSGKDANFSKVSKSLQTLSIANT